ncbi:MAG: hypothetical protein M3Q65_14425 [Chloroflexota bacterium]|nr:hypothetical protein [Chloroflexota bacterium]
MPRRGGGIEALLESVPIRLREEGLRRLGIVVDADVRLSPRWQAVRDRLRDSGYRNIPAVPPAEGWISSEPELPRVGVWLMPDNLLAGMLEDFATRLIPTSDALLARAEAAVRDLEEAGLNRYTLAHHSKALIHTWLAWQETPGQPLGQAITAEALDSNLPLARAFVAWLRRLFDL